MAILMCPLDQKIKTEIGDHSAFQLYRIRKTHPQLSKYSSWTGCTKGLYNSTPSQFL